MTGDRVRSLLAVSWWLVRRPPLLAPAVAALLLTGVSLLLMEVDYQALRLMRGVALLLACAWVAAMDDPAGEVTAASPYSRTERSLSRLAATGAVVVPTWVVCAAAVERVVPQTPVLGTGVEALALAALGVAVGAGLRAWRDIHMASQLAVLGLLAIALLTNVMPRWYLLVQPQPWGPPWEAAQIRWWALALVAVGVLALALRDPVRSRARTGTDDP